MSYIDRVDAINALHVSDIDRKTILDMPDAETNGDKVRSMTNEEISEWFWVILDYLRWYTDSRLALRDWLNRGIEK